jgi:hypothetical protein
VRARIEFKRIAAWCALVLLPHSLVLADELPPVVLADAAKQSPEDPEWTSQFMEQSRKASNEAARRCAPDGKVPMGTVWQNSSLQLVVTYKCVSRDDPKFKAARSAPATINPIAPEQAAKTCAAQGKTAKEFGLKTLTFYACVSSPKSQ